VGEQLEDNKPERPVGGRPPTVTGLCSLNSLLHRQAARC